MCSSFRGRRSTLDLSIVIFRSRRSTLDVSCCVFFASRIGRTASSGDKVQIPCQAWHFVWGAENWRTPRTKHRFWGCKFSGSKQNSKENVDFAATKCENWRKSRTKCSFWCSHLSRLASLVFPWPRRVYGGSCKICPFVMLPTVKIAGSLVRNDRFGAPTCLVSSRWCSYGFAVSMGEAAKPLLFEGFRGSCHVVLRARRGTLWHSNLFDNVSNIVQTRERRGSSFSQLGLEPNHTGLTAQSLFFLEESCRVKRSDTQMFSNFANYFTRVLKLQKRSSSFSK